MTNHDIKEKFVLNLDHYKDLLNKELLKRAEFIKYEDPCFHNEIDDQFVWLAKIRIAEDMTKVLSVTTEDVLVALEDIDLKGLLC